MKSRTLNCIRAFSLGVTAGLAVGCSSPPSPSALKMKQALEEPNPQLAALGAVKGTTVEEGYAFGLVRVIDKSKVQLLGIKFFEEAMAYPPTPPVPCPLLRDPLEGRAYYKAMEKQPDADAIWQPTSTVKTTGFPFLYKKKEVTITGQAVRLKGQ